ncbi:MAG TPA: hypothetical protein VD766_10995 [Solirubrobacterales bacterium]|nr:hypothetical protein [Solirubrobacterales bacterium]
MSLSKRLVLVGLCLTAAAWLPSCSDSPIDNAAAKPAELARYLPENSKFIQTVDVARAREELDLPEDANALPTSDKTFPRPKSPEAELFQVTSRAYPDVAEVFQAELHGRGASPLDGTLIRAAAGEIQGVSIVSTAEPIEDVERKLELAGYSLKGKIYQAGDETPEAASRFVADAGSGRIVFADEHEVAQEVLKRIVGDAKPGHAAKTLAPLPGSVRLAMTNPSKKSCVSAFAAAQEATGERATMALAISGDKPDPDRFDSKPLEGIATGTPTVLVDSLIVPIRVKRPLRDGLDAINQVITTSGEIKGGHNLKFSELPPLPPFQTYDCP